MVKNQITPTSSQIIGFDEHNKTLETKKRGHALTFFPIKQL